MSLFMRLARVCLAFDCINLTKQSNTFASGKLTNELLTINRCLTN